MCLFTPPYPPYDPKDKNGFASVPSLKFVPIYTNYEFCVATFLLDASYETVHKRWPVIVTKLIDHIHRVNHDLTMAGTGANAETEGESASVPESDWEARVEEGKGIIEKVSKLKYEMARDRALLPMEDDGGADVDTYNRQLERLAENGVNTWFTAPWLYAECYLYRLLWSWFAQTMHWHHYDPFLAGKQDSFKASSAAIYKLAATMHEFEETKSELETDPNKLAVLFNEMIQMCLWGNATDLSLLTNLTHEDILKLQSVGKDAQKERKAFILRDDEKDAFSYLTTLRESRVDLVLDNAGFELFTDLVFADFLVTYTPYVSNVVFHPKSIPWFVSDVTPPDFKTLFAALRSETFFVHEAPSDSARDQLANLLTRWEGHLARGAFSLSVPIETKLGEKNELSDFWTTAYPYWEMNKKAPALFGSLKDSGLVILKGDLNYRKLTGDVKWPAATPMTEAIGPLAGEFPLLSLRTSKADVVVGVDKAKADALDESGEKWRVNGKYAMISFIPRGKNV